MSSGLVAVPLRAEPSHSPASHSPAIILSCFPSLLLLWLLHLGLVALLAYVWVGGHFAGAQTTHRWLRHTTEESAVLQPLSAKEACHGHLFYPNGVWNGPVLGRSCAGVHSCCAWLERPGWLQVEGFCSTVQILWLLHSFCSSMLPGLGLRGGDPQMVLCWRLALPWCGARFENMVKVVRSLAGLCSAEINALNLMKECLLQHTLPSLSCFLI